MSPNTSLGDDIVKNYKAPDSIFIRTLLNKAKHVGKITTQQDLFLQEAARHMNADQMAEYGSAIYQSLQDDAALVREREREKKMSVGLKTVDVTGTLLYYVQKRYLKLLIAINTVN